MGHRANLILVENKTPKIYSDHWDGQKTPNLLAQGLVYCENHFKGLKEDGYLMDNVWAEGGILIDKDKQNVLFFNVEFLESVALQNAFINYLEQNIWINWTIKWAFRGNVDFAEYLNLMDDHILADGSKPNFHNLKDSSILKLREEDSTFAALSLITIVEKDLVKDFVLLGDSTEVNYCLARGIALKDYLSQAFETVAPEKIKESEIEDILLVDYHNKAIFVCWVYDTDDRHLSAIKDIWPGWDCKRQTKGVSFNFEYTQREKSYLKITAQEFKEYLNKWKLLAY